MFVGAFEFEEGGRSFRCCVEQERSARAGAWWWFAVSGDTQRYAPFHPQPGDTKQSIRVKIAAYYNDLLVRRAMPAVPRYGRKGGSGFQAGGTPVTPVATDATGDAETQPSAYPSVGSA